jgi:hypothetical protein
VKHGMSRTKVYQVYRAMLARCLSPNHPQYDDYGGRGIAVCERWMAFENFLADMGEPPDGMTLDRLENNKGYEPGNCAWRTRRQQQNNMRSNRVLELDGRSMTASEWARELGWSINTIHSRVKAGWDDRRILTTPVSSKFAPNKYKANR